ncbi:uncharacterized protein LOC128734108 isoform X2 [Sabethes cyaneus]|uniref:uncharacterized protein LOC128734108 isoform X2 n=1 Tax=Sabethes cyaneus TaxID=53552 RepID=UPI00237DC63D|nr:uncharacterized protein LOC128734108 isoform X2 [Sabethes cyaneus]
MEYRETTRWYLKRLYQNEHKIINIGATTDISRSLTSVITLNRQSFQHVSKRHCTISCVNGLATIKDETSTCGTFVNDVKLSKETPGSVVLAEGDRIGVGSPCFQDPSFYEKNEHVLLYIVCKDRNRIIREGDVDTILSSDDEGNVTPNLQTVPQEKMPEVPEKNDKQYRILGNIDLSSDVEEEDVICLNYEDNVTRLDQAIMAQTEKKAREQQEMEWRMQRLKQIEQKNNLNQAISELKLEEDSTDSQKTEQARREDEQGEQKRKEKEDLEHALAKQTEKNRKMETTRFERSSGEDKVQMLNQQQENKPKEVDQRNTNEIRKEIHVRNENEKQPEEKKKHSNKHYTKHSSTSRKESADNGSTKNKEKDKNKYKHNEKEHKKKSRHKSKDRHTSEHRRHSSKSSDNTGHREQNNHHGNRCTDEKLTSKEPELPFCVDQIEELFKDSLALPSDAIETISVHDSESDSDNEFSEQKFSQSYYRQIKQEALEVDLPDDNEPDIHDEAVNSNQPVLNTPLLDDSETIYISEDDDDEETLEDSKRWFKKLSQRSSPLRGKVQINKAQSIRPALTLETAGIKSTTKTQTATPNVPCHNSTACVSEKAEAIDSVPRPSDVALTNQTVARLAKKINVPLDDNPASAKRKRSLEERIQEGEDNLDDSFFADILTEFEDLGTIVDTKVSEAKKSKVQQTEATDSSYAANTVAKSTSLKPSTSTRPNEKNSNSASTAWTKRKVPVVEPHHIPKRRSSIYNGASSSKILKLDNRSPIRKITKSNETLKEKLKAINCNKSQSGDESRKQNCRSFTKPKCKFTPKNRGAFLVQESPSLNQAKPNSLSDKSRDNSHSNNVDDFICTQSTSLENLPDLDKMIAESVRKAPKLTFDNVAKVSSVAINAPAFRIPKQRSAPPPKLTLTDSESFRSILNNINLPSPPAQVDRAVNSLTNGSTSPSNKLRSILKSNNYAKHPKEAKRVNWNNILTDTRVFEIDEGNEMFVQTRDYKENYYNCHQMTQACLNDILLQITSWNPEWFDNPAEAKVCETRVLPMVEEYRDFEEYKRIVVPILKVELFHDILAQYEQIRKTDQQPLQMKLNQIRAQSRVFVLNCSVEISSHQSINKKDYVLIIFRDKTSGETLRVPAVVTTRRQLVQYVAENGVKFFHCTLETAKTELSQRIRGGFGESFRIMSLTQINMHLRQFQALVYLENSALLENVLCPKSNFYSYRIDKDDRRLYKGKDSLNLQQGDTLLSVFHQCLDMNQPHIMLIQGPPGTGKSRLISNLVMQLHRSFPINKKLKILVCTQSNTAVDVIVLKLIKLFRLLSKEEQANVLRTGAANKINHECKIVFLDELAKKRVNTDIKHRRLRKENPSLETYLVERENLERRLKYLLHQATMQKNANKQAEIKEIQEKLNRIQKLLPADVDNIDEHDDNRRDLEKLAKKELVTMADIVCTTLGSCGGLTEYSRSLRFDVCIIDEATQCTEIASFSPLQYNIRKLILVGDPKQLPPLVFGKEAAEAGLKNSLFSRIQNSFIGTQFEGVKVLTKQYRMHPEILKWPNEFFYEGKLTSDLQSTKCDEFPFKPYTVFSLEYQQNQTQSEHQIYNDEEIKFVLKLLSEIMKFCERHTSIAIITPYTRHKKEIEKDLRSRRITQVSVLSIDSVQGQEYDVVIISLARSLGMGFLDSPQRLNVALTRARKCLILCGNFADLQAIELWSALLKDAEDRKLLFNIEDNDEYSDVDTFVERVMQYLRKPPV